MARSRRKDDENTGRHPDGHALVDGARWHYPRMGDPTACAIDGCDRVLDPDRRKASFPDMSEEDDS